jgi:trimeric autotransporter adhesin
MKKLIYTLFLSLFFFGAKAQKVSLQDSSRSVEITPYGVKLYHNKPTYDSSNLGSGVGVLKKLITGKANTVVGDSNATNLSNSSRNTLVGVGIMKKANSGNANTVLGALAAGTNQGNNLIAMGFGAAGDIVNVDYNISVGTLAGTGAQVDNRIAIGGLASYSGFNTNSVLVGHTAGSSILVGVRNVAIGAQALNAAPGNGGDLSAQNIIAVGHKALLNGANSRESIGIGYNTLSANEPPYVFTKNIAVGYEAMQKHTRGNSNIAVGRRTMRNDIGSLSNIAIGYESLYNTNYGNHNLAIGAYSGGFGFGDDQSFGFDDGVNNIFIGYASAISSQSYFSSNVAVGSQTLQSLQALAQANVAVGWSAGKTVDSDSRMTFIGAETAIGASAPGFTQNSTAIGYGATITASNQIVFGNDDVDKVEGKVAWSLYSDRRLKSNINYSDALGLELIKALKPAYYIYKTDKNKRKQLGILADDLEQYLNQNNVQFSALRIADNKQKTKSVAYAELALPLINAVQTLDKKLTQSTQNWTPLNPKTFTVNTDQNSY